MFENVKKLFEIHGPETAELKLLEEDKTYVITVGAEETILTSALDAGIEFPHSCRVGSCGRCKCQVTEGEVRNLSDPSFTLSEAEIKDGFVLACRSQPLSAIKAEVPAYRSKKRNKMVASTAV